jgi:hypothetical protein
MITDLAAGFADPPPEARPMVYWVWLNGNVTAQGITADLEAMARVGIGEVLLMNGSLRTPPGPALYLTDEWLDLLRHALTELRRLGMRMSLFNCDGFALCGSPAVTPDVAMRKLTWTEKIISGPGRVRLELPSLERDGADLAVLAVPAPDSGILVPLPTGVNHRVPPSYQHDQLLEVELDEAVEAASLLMVIDGDEYHVNADRPDGYAELSVAADGHDLQVVGQVRVDSLRSRYPAESITCSFDPVRVRRLRLRFVRSAGLTLRQLRLSPDVLINGREYKAGLAEVTQHGAESGSTAFSTKPRPGHGNRPPTLDLTGRVRDGVLDFQAPPGRWLIIRIGQRPTGKQNHPATSTGQGLECDKYSAAGVETVLRNTIDRIISGLDPELRAVIRAVHSDSYECGPANWTPDWREEFTRRRGYDPQPWLPVLTSGVTFGDPNSAERFLFDHRRTLAELYAERYLGRHWELAAERGLEFQSESCGRQQYMYDPVSYFSQCDVPMGEFWLGPPPYEGVRADCRAAASAAHLNGRIRVAAEAFTSLGAYSGFTETPASLKPLGDLALCTGINQFVIHRFVHQPWDLQPGLAFGPFGIHFERTNTWFEQSGGWMRYLARCQWLLRQGRPVADVLYYLGDDVPNRIGDRGRESMPVPPGLDFDACDLAVLQAATVEDGRITLPGGGGGYRYLLLPDRMTMRPQALAEIARLVAAGATVIGDPPRHSPSLENYPDCDREVADLAAGLWGGSAESRVLRPTSWEEILDLDRVPLDLAGPDGMAYIHRSLDDAEIYFVANPTDRLLSGRWRFRVANLVPQRWDPETGERQGIANWTRTDSAIELSLELDPSESTFVVFVPASFALPAPAAPAAEPSVYSLTGPWTLTVADRDEQVNTRLDALTPLNALSDPRLRFFSGTAHYAIPLPEEALRPARDGVRVVLDLGTVSTIAEVRLGDVVRTLWHPPYRLDITAVLRDLADPTLRIDVTTTWVNRLIGDENEPDDLEWGPWVDGPNNTGYPIADWPDWLHSGSRPSQRRTFHTWKHYRADDPLLDSGLIGPVTLQSTPWSAG